MQSKQTIGETFKTSQKAATILEDLMPSDWLIREQNPDIHVDYVVEVVEQGEPAGLEFGIQLKGTQPKNGRSPRMAYSLKAKHLRYYIEKVEKPVFLVLLDVIARKAYWCFVQKFAKENWRPEKWKMNGTVSLPFPKEDCLDDIPRFKKAIYQAREYMKALRPGTIKAAVEAERYKLQELDPRVDVKIDVKDGKPHFTLFAKEEYAFSMGVGGIEADPDMQQAFSDFIEKGSELKVSAAALKFEGSPILSHLFEPSETGLVVIRCAHEVPGTIQFFERGVDPRFILQMEGKYSCGAKYATFETKASNSALSFSTMIPTEGSVRLGEHQLGISCDVMKWSGQPLLQLAQFDATRKFASVLDSGNGLMLKLLADGNELFQTELLEKVQPIGEMIELLHKARFVGAHCGLNPILPSLKSIPAAQWRIIERAYDLLSSGECKRSRPNTRISFKTVNPIPKELPIRGFFRVDRSSLRADFFGSRIELGPVTNIFSNVAIVSATSDGEGLTDISIEGSEETICTTKRNFAQKMLVNKNDAS